ncbi:YibE/F family protein [Sporomusa paucivorans]
MLPDRFVNPVYKQFETAKARVISVNNSDIQRAGIVAYGQQQCMVELLDGSYQGTVAEAMNMLSGSLGTDKQYQAGDIALVTVGGSQSQGVYKISMVDHYRLNYQLLLVGAFMLLLIVLAGWIGVRAILAFAFTILCIWKMLIPLLLAGYQPILCGLLITAMLTTVIIILVYGFDRRFIAATMGSLLGTGLTALLAIIFVNMSKIHGAVMDYSESLLYTGFQLNLTEIFIASIFIASAGAVMDIAVDITSAVHEVIEANPAISKAAAIKAGLNVGRTVIGTMSTTLLLAYSGGYIGLLMVFVAQGTPVINILNLNYISAEILNTMIGSFGLITVAPFTAVTSATLLTRKKSNAAEAAV